MIFEYNLEKPSSTLKFEYDSRCFIPTATSDFIIKSCSNHISKKSDLLDLGCGVGIVGISLFKMNLVKRLYSSDISSFALKMCKKNSKNYNIENDIRLGSVLEPWRGMKFDVIVDDISGISKHIAEISPWFSNVACESGPDGTILTIEVLEKASEFLNKKGKLFFPIISLSNHKKILEITKSLYNNVKMISSNKWFIPEEVSVNHNKLMNELKNSGYIDFEEKFGKKIAFTDVYMVNN
tara:strand:- start:1758 stop:2471 length:714 start_codon:yes stop_codon:yes gene_type:complete